MEYVIKQTTLMTRHDAKRWTILGCALTANMAAPYAMHAVKQFLKNCVREHSFFDVQTDFKLDLLHEEPSTVLDEGGTYYLFRVVMFLIRNNCECIYYLYKI